MKKIGENLADQLKAVTQELDLIEGRKDQDYDEKLAELRSKVKELEEECGSRDVMRGGRGAQWQARGNNQRAEEEAFG